MVAGLLHSIGSSRGLRAGVAAVSAAAMVLGSAGSALAQNFSLIRDAEIEEILREDCDPIFKAAGLKPEDVKIFLVNNKELNAFVSGGQQVFLHTGMIMRTKTPNELLGVVAHETAHIAGGHLARSGQGERSALATYAVTFGLGILAAMAGAGDAAAGLMYSSGYFATLQLLSYTRTQESAADQAAAKYLDEAGLSGKGLVEFFYNLRYQEVFSEARQYAYFRSHPISSQRVEALRAEAEAKPNYNKPSSPEDLAEHAIMLAKLRGFTDYPQQIVIDYPASDTSYPARYARAIAAYRATETDKALRLIDELIAEQPQNPYLWELKGQVLYESGKIKDSEEPHRKSVELKPDAPLLRINLAQTLIALEDDARLDEAIDHVKRALSAEQESPMAYRLLSQAYDRKQEPGMARLAAAEQHFYLGQGLPARDFALRARELLPKDTPQWQQANDIVQTVDNAERQVRGRSRTELSTHSH